MARIIYRTNPERTKTGAFRCCVCHDYFDTEEEARSCAEGDHAKRRGAYHPDGVEIVAT